MEIDCLYGGNQPQIAVWSDGRIVWRMNDSLRQAHIDARKIEGLVERLHREGVFGDGDTYYGNTGPDSDSEVIDVRLADRRLQLESWHDLYEQNPRLVATTRGVETLEGRNRDKALAAEPRAYQRFRRVWSEIRATVRLWVPEEGEAFNGMLVVGGADRLAR